MSDHEEESVRSDVRAWLKDNWTPDRPLLEWRNQLADSGWGCPTWPEQWYGRGLPVHFEGLVSEEFRRIGAPGIPSGVGPGLAGVTLLEHGSDEQKKSLLRPIITGEGLFGQQLVERQAAKADTPSIE